MIAEQKLDFYGGIFVFNPLDDEYHLERIQNCITSICTAAEHSKHAIKIVVGLNKSIVNFNEQELLGVGPKTIKLIEILKNQYNFDIIEHCGINACSRGYNMLLQYGHKNTDAEKLVIFADDYIMPNFWFDLMELNFKIRSDAYFIMPATCFVAQENLRYDIGFHPDWDVRVAEKGDHKKWNVKTIYGGVKIEHINEIAKQFVNNGLVDYYDPPSFETTIFKRKLIDIVGFIHDEYYSCFYDNDYFKLITNQNLKGYIAKNCFIFHYGKGATKALYKETADEKYEESPVLSQLLSDINTWNTRWNQNVKPWWGKKMSFKDLYYLNGEEGREDLQIYWHNFISNYVKNSTILDVGSGLGLSKGRLSKNGNIVYTQEPAPEMIADFKKDISEFDDEQYDYVVSFDVIEHVPNDIEFLKNLFRICKKAVFIATPNYFTSLNVNPYHFREYKPQELVELCENFSTNLKFFSDCGKEIEIEFYRKHLREQPFIVYKIQENTKQEFLNLDHKVPHLGVLLIKEGK